MANLSLASKGGSCIAQGILLVTGILTVTGYGVQFDVQKLNILIQKFMSLIVAL